MYSFCCVPLSTVISLDGLHLLPYTVQCRSYSKKTVNQPYDYSTVLGASIKCKPYSEITVESGTQLKTVHICSAVDFVSNLLENRKSFIH